MIKYHSLFLRNLEERGTSFNAILSDVFLDFSAFFKVSKMYISNYATFIQIFANKSKNKETSEKIKRITAAEPTGTNREISSYLITPVQRMPRYILFIRELIKHTPQAHPDAVLLKNAAIQIQKVTEQIDDSTQKAENMSKLLAIHSRLTNKFDLLLPSRNFVMKCDVYVKPQNSSGVFYLFNDMVFLTAIERKGETYIYDKPVEEFKYWNGIPNLESITFLPKSGNIKSRFQSRKDFSIQFSTQEEKNGFLEMVRNIKFELLSRSDDLNRMFIFENCPVSKLLPSVTGHDAVAFNQMLFSFGGENNGDPQNNFLLYSITQGGSSNNILPLISPRYNHAMINDNDKIYLFGGTDGSDFFNDLYIYSLKEKVWEKIQAENPPEPRSGHSLVYYKNKLYVFGGINKKKKPLNDVAIYMIDRNIWRYEIFSGSPEPRYHHSACICGSSMIIHGGKGKSNILNDIACFDLEKILWINIQINTEAIGGLLPRYGHKSFYVGGYIVFIGGADDSGIVNPTTINVNNNWACENYLMGGNDPLSLFRFALTYEIGSHVIVYGGCEYDSKNGTSCVYTVTMPPIIASNLSESYPPDPPNKCLSDNSSYSSSDNTESEKSFSSCKSDGIKMIKMSDSFKRNTYIPTNMLPNNVREQEKENRDQQEENLTIAMLAARKARTMSLMNIQIEPKSPPLSYLFEEPVVINDEMIKHLIETEYNEEEFCQALCIDSSEIAPFQKKILTRKLNALYAKIQNNATIEKQIDSLLNISSHLDHKIPKFEVFVKLLFENQIIILKTLSTIGFKAFLKEINICIKKKCKRIMTNSHSELTHTLLLGEIKMILNNTKHHIILTVE
ncbi:hypothetical protein TRFO_28376 [Tritrichomonas foetus]|uniref:DH domain-containing protein n=1 Tax=Tritrichomonas foetus TaxID=1144522 RepID=A0A1J4JYG6_9EUKA|nr:hypothetical protein TRFO_28376 [Tritrichomonas foetus]|eukprot:OHT04201.1 hypothetical protein TRFO_28376 [Tritrichomonas foetus]